MKATLKITVSHKLFHNDSAAKLGEMRATVTRTLDKYQVRFSSVDFTDAVNTLPHMTLSVLRDVVRGHVTEWFKDEKYCFLWNEETGLESYIRYAN